MGMILSVLLTLEVCFKNQPKRSENFVNVGSCEVMKSVSYPERNTAYNITPQTHRPAMTSQKLLFYR